ncbi:MAG: AmmeMemoRadiSam system radical SAM enzyme [Thermodesulfobacteriota bacterium]
MGRITRRRFLSGCAACLCCQAFPEPAGAFWPFGKKRKTPGGEEDVTGRVFSGDAPESPWKWSHEGAFYTKMFDHKVVCGICPHKCVLSPGDRSLCRSRVNIGGVLYSLTYGNPCSVNIDPIEKKPLFHFMPRTTSFSIACAGCNFRCLNCQNWEISQAKPHEVRHTELFPGEVVAAARRAGAGTIAYTYSEPITFYEYMLETARLARAESIRNVLISAGYINEEPLLNLCRYLDGANINLKSFSDGIYRKLNGGRLDPVLKTFKTLHAQKVHFEMTNLVVPGYVDDPEMVKRMCAWILDNLGPDNPLHFIRFFPKYKLDRLPPTPVSTLTRFRELAMQAGIRYVYVGNVPGHEGHHTYCHACGKLLIRREGYFIPEYNLSGHQCRFCREVIPGVWPGEPSTG